MPAEPTDIIPADWQRWSSVQPTLLRPLAGGLTNSSYLLSAGERRLVLRRNSPNSAALDLDRVAEIRALQEADSAGLCAPLVHADPAHKYLVTEYLEGQPFPRADNATLLQLAELARGIHALPAIDAKLDIRSKAERYWQAIDTDAEFSSSLSGIRKSTEVHIDRAASLCCGPKLCHNDLNATNLIATNSGGLYAVDWEYAAMGDAFYELAVIVEEHQLSEPARQQLLGHYLGREVGYDDRQRLHHWRVVYRYLTVLWYAVQHYRGAMPGQDSLAAIRRQLDTISTLMQSTP
ncbi:choline/ethanolamine kinase family protein [Biformimicrobium ophioploci]|uniref:Thiamine kinase n=1 Tax=Biformimicrobium ophioploci TaxID=3036711 RepID=A0ABQ6LW74_9GAMM|nr:choline/ethanolamine kinase family protein [Microbulbifer sp. NKW57]GMG86343.1 thiamine kinase [Microbulbifer sp. NKW57]